MENLVGYGKDDLLRPLLLEHEDRAGCWRTWPARTRPRRAGAIRSTPPCTPRSPRRPPTGSEARRHCSHRCRRCKLRIGPAPVTRKVDKLSTVRIGSARYLVPTALIGTGVAVQVSGTAVLVRDVTTGQVHAEHELVAPGEASVRDKHYGGARPAPRRAVRAKTAAEKQFCALGPAAEDLRQVRPDRRVGGRARCAAGAGVAGARLDGPEREVRLLVDFRESLVSQETSIVNALR